MTLLDRIGLGLCVLGGLFALLNWLYVFASWRTGRFHSAVPLVGGLLMGVGLLLLPATRPWAWLAILLDYGTLVCLLAAPAVAAEMWRTSRFNLVEEYAGDAGGKTVRLRLFRRGVFTLVQEMQRRTDQWGLMRASTIGEWHREPGRLVLNLYGEQAAFKVVLGSDVPQLVQMDTGRKDVGSELSIVGVSLWLVRCHGPAEAPS